MTKLRADGHEQLKKIAKSRSGECLSPRYSGRTVKYLWKCKLGHVWEAAFYNVERGTWCPECSSGKSERICRAIFENIFKVSFPKKRPAWLKTLEGNRLELDGYNESLGLAFEHNGDQHYLVSFAPWHNSSSLEDIRQRDMRKRELCKLQGVKLITIPSLGTRLLVKDLPSFIFEECKKLAIPMPDICPSSVDFSSAYTNDHWALEQVRNLVMDKNGKLLTDFVTNNKVKLMCSQHHTWSADIHHILRGQWCRKCSGSAKKSLSDLQKYAASRSGRCLAKTYVNSTLHVEWQCQRGHIWSAKPGAVLTRKSWCPVCGGYGPKDLNWLLTLAKENNGLCLATEYISGLTSVEWKCHKGHQWMAKGTHIASGRWCPVCAKEEKIKRCAEYNRKRASKGKDAL